ncbi:hypothetical protein SLEP1_g20762 [Rubroshorea leprosula]|uniref:Pectinesterase inhibitor domain-containing protein n=1 Tax=Rubroshorea leprosula TaxID=152421 RepID=A0AAV5JEF4_9ROSI|nr:hypothetical protein SLEP1_g20762 [Rubroshorea leprosula]
MNIFLLILFFIFPLRGIRPAPIIQLSNLIDQTCKQTPFYELCTSILLSNPKSADADIAGLARIMVTSLDSKASDTLDQINDLLEDTLTLDPATQQALALCAERYNVILTGDIPQTIAGLDRGNYKFAQKGTNDAALEASACEKGFPSKRKSPINELNKEVRHISIVAAAIVKVMIDS